MTLPYKFITFDCYGTLIDWEAGICGAFQETAEADGVTLDRERIMQVYHRIEPDVQALQFRKYRDVLEDVALACAQRLRFSLPPERAGLLATSLPSWQPFPETNDALERLKQAGFSLGILSNIDNDLLAGTLRHFSVDFDLIVTAEQVQSYKPAHGHFLEARTRISSGRWLHAAQSYYHDVVPCRELQMPVVWVNRKHERPAGVARPEGEVDTLKGLVEWLGM